MNSFYNPRVSIIIPAYNAGSYLKRCIENVLSQTVSDWELIIIDDGSNDSTGMIADEYAANDERIRVFHTINGGASRARNLGMDYATGEYISFIDADDSIDSVFYETLLDLAVDSNADISQCSFSYVYDDALSINDKSSINNVFRGEEDIVRAYFTGSIGKINICIWNKLFNREVTKGIRFDENLSIYEDAFFSYNCCRKASCVACTDKVLYHYNQHNGSVMESAVFERWKDYFVVFDREIADYSGCDDILTLIMSRELETALYLIHRMIEKGITPNSELRSQALKYMRQMLLLRTVPFRLKAKMMLLKTAPKLYYERLKSTEFDVSFPLADPNVRNRIINDLLFSLVGSSLICSILMLFNQISTYYLFLIWVIAFTVFALVYYYLWSRTDIIRNIHYFIYSIVNSKRKKNVFCSCCGHEFTSFKENTYFRDKRRFNYDRFRNSRQDVICPFCGSSPRHRIVAEWCKKNIEELSKSRNLYFACESSMKRWFVKNGIHLITADLFSNADLKLDITNINLPDDSFDFIFCNHVLEHVSDYKSALYELRRILAPEGMLIISFPIDSSLNTVYERKDLTTEERVRLFGQYDHFRLFGSDSKELLENFGFMVNTIDISELSERILPVVGPSEYDSNSIFLCTKARKTNGGKIP